MGRNAEWPWAGQDWDKIDFTINISLFGFSILPLYQDYSEITNQRALALTESMEDELETYKQLYNNSKKEIEILNEKCQTLESALSVKSTNNYLSQSLITSVSW